MTNKPAVSRDFWRGLGNALALLGIAASVALVLLWLLT